MSTPRTDAACFDSFEHPLTHQNCEVVKADFARQLETQVQELREALEKIAAKGKYDEPTMNAGRMQQLARAILEKTS